ncbi:dicarboxylate/amino acid:cation symporter [Helcobacillus massiliensis]|uniref:dicarboxylate/amino acid:cation symporter n=1 Tax=Helcobacillus massiliensis TaxID=521392 RepID=UPI0025547220|nr:dicarboxylate/amino acid:cation symporter [Helcobacillus massiliensis]MDK7741313.1 dicarboxylate/amino acid:cation symporter [Helcobacillus massiliensis]WOO92836.1 dicarboxylate/amino acid:cation symporter [Helcobacillus massiliensis]
MSTSTDPRTESAPAPGGPQNPSGRPGPVRRAFDAVAGIPFGYQVIAGLILGVILGFIAAQMGPAAPATGDADPVPNWLTVTLDTIGTTFITLLKALVPPLIFLAVVASIANLREVTGAARLAWKTLLWFGITALISVGVGMAVGTVMNLGSNTGLSADAAQAPDKSGTWLDFLTGLVPSNFIGLTASASDDGVKLTFNALQILVISIAVGIATLSVGEKAEPFLAFVRAALEVVQKVLWWVIRLAPIGTIGLIGYAVVDYGWSTIGALGSFVLALYIGLAIVAVVVYPLVLKSNGLGVMDFYRGVWPATQLGFVSRSSLGTMPVTKAVTEKNLGVPAHYASFAVPFGSVSKMDGCAAVYPALAAIFVANFFQVPLGVTDYLLIAFVSVLGSAATAGMTGAVVMLTLTLSTLGLPLAGVGLLMAVDPIVDMGRTALNVTGQALVPAVVSKREGILDEAAYRSRENTAVAG